MPLINGCKYSCEPCIRGHRATSCAHTDRILLEVRKPGRPLESCGHEFATCNCGKITELLSIGTVLPIPGSDQASQHLNSALVLTSPPPTPAIARPKEHPRSHRRVSKKAKRKKGESPSMSPSTNRSSREPSAMFEESEQNMQYAHLAYGYQDQVYPGGGSTAAPQQSSFVQYPSPPYPAMQSPTQSPQTFGPYQTGHTPNNQEAYAMAYPPQTQAGYADAYSSRVEDLERAPYQQSDNAGLNQPHIRSQYIVAKQDSAWGATREG
ncbi:copper-fist-domain-containing protein [Stipitochalara longipes BDJ]|nr:copper-fist-domain-containing protein [Stipitochalara longipes BDJ]